MTTQNLFQSATGIGCPKRVIGATRPRVGKTYLHQAPNGKLTVGKVVSIARVRNGVVLAFLESGKGIPVTKHGVWVETGL